MGLALQVLEEREVDAYLAGDGKRHQRSVARARRATVPMRISIRSGDAPSCDAKTTKARGNSA